MRRTLLAATSATLVAGCAGMADSTGPPSYVGPDEYEVESSRTINKSYDETWTAIVDFLSENNVPLDNVDKDSGLITSERARSQQSGPFIDCGDLEGGYYTWEVGREDVSQNINIRARKIDEKTTRVHADVFGSGVIYGYSMGDERPYDAQCVSTGELEQSLYRAID